jgi:hypothetical protein
MLSKEDKATIIGIVSFILVGLILYFLGKIEFFDNYFSNNKRIDWFDSIQAT